MDTGPFYGVTFSEKEPLAQLEVDESDLHVLDVKKLIIKHICLGVEAKEGEFNGVQAETKATEEMLKIPIVVFKVGETRVVRRNVKFPSATVTFKLIQGTGPVYIYGQHVVTEAIEEEWFHDDVEPEKEYDDEAPPQPQTNGKNRNKRNKFFCDGR